MGCKVCQRRFKNLSNQRSKKLPNIMVVVRSLKKKMTKMALKIMGLAIAITQGNGQDQAVILHRHRQALDRLDRTTTPPPLTLPRLIHLRMPNKPCPHTFQSHFGRNDFVKTQGKTLLLHSQHITARNNHFFLQVLIPNPKVIWKLQLTPVGYVWKKHSILVSAERLKYMR